MWPVLNKYGVYYPIQWFRDEPIWKWMPEFVRTETLGKQALKFYTEGKLRILLHRLYSQSPFYRECLQKIGYSPTDPFDWEIFRQLPMMDKATIRAIGTEALAGPCVTKASKRSTSGSTGQPFTFLKDRIASTCMEATMYQVYGWYGIGVGDRQGRLWGTPLDHRLKTYQRIKDHLLNRRRLSAFAMDEDDCMRYWRVLQDFRPSYFYGYPNAIVRFAEYLSRNNIQGRTLSLTGVICTGEMLFPQNRAIIQNVFGCPVVNEYGSTENGIIAFECPHGGLHVMNQNLLLECVNAAGEPVVGEEAGTFLVTEFHSHVLPFLRYRLGDRGRISGTDCVCGRRYPLIDLQIGRLDSFIVTPEGARVYDAILAYSFKDVFSHFKAFQTNPSSLHIVYVSKAPLAPQTLEQLERRLRQHLGSTIAISFERTDVIPPDPSGKLQYFSGMR
jgi:phenylacetate-CoA ligase